jgi:2,4-dienoyl-CoA reductase-like NADH-dependent reductase (Old Yellow Enzyme family)
MSQPQLFQPIRVANLELENRIIVAPMCQYSAVDGCMADWHLIHLGNLALSGAALVTIEATAVMPSGRISYGDVGLYDDATELAMRNVLESIRRVSETPIGIQLCHAGRKASQEVPWLGGGPDRASQRNRLADLCAFCSAFPDKRKCSGCARYRTVCESACNIDPVRG